MIWIQKMESYIVRCDLCIHRLGIRQPDRIAQRQATVLGGESALYKRTSE